MLLIKPHFYNHKYGSDLNVLFSIFFENAREIRKHSPVYDINLLTLVLEV